MSIERRNYGRGHGYRVDGQKTPGVTTIVGATMPKDALVKWAADQTANYAVDHWAELTEEAPSKRLKRLQGARFEDRDAASNRGTEVHRLAELYISGQEVDVPDELDGHVRSYEQFVSEFDVTPIHTEFLIVNRTVGYCGTVDLLADLTTSAGIERWLLDLKTSRSGIFAETVLQLTGYRFAENYATLGEDGKTYDEHPMSDLGIQRVGAVHVTGDGYKLLPIDVDGGSWEYFRHLAWLYRRQEDLPEFIGPALRPPRRPAAAAAAAS